MVLSPHIFTLVMDNKGNLENNPSTALPFSPIPPAEIGPKLQATSKQSVLSLQKVKTRK
jgi:hypothetical protein